MMKRICLALVLSLVMSTLAFGATGFEDLTVPAEGYYNGSDEAGSFTSADATFNNDYNPTYMSWSGFAYSNMTDTTTPGLSNQYSAITGQGVAGSATYALGFTNGYGGPLPAELTFAAPTAVTGFYATNTTYAYLSMRDGDAFAKQFGGVTGDDPDFFLLTIRGYDASDTLMGEVEFYLADYRFTDNSLDYLLDDWNWVDLTGLGTVSKLVFELTSSDNGAYGMNTPAYVALDNLNSPLTDGDSGCFITTADSQGVTTGLAAVVALFVAMLGALTLNKK